MRELIYEHGAVLLVAGLPGAGKTTFLRRTATGPGVVVLDSDDVRRRLHAVGLRGRVARPLVHAGHLARVVRAVLGAPGAVVVHETGTRPRVRRALARLAARRGRACHALFLDVEPAQAAAAQRARGRRPVPSAAMARHERAWRVLRRRLRDRDALRADGYRTARTLDRPAAAAIERIRFSPAR